MKAAEGISNPLGATPPDSPFYYTALVRIKGGKAAARAQYSMVSLRLSAKQADKYVSGSSIKEELDAELHTSFEDLIRDPQSSPTSGIIKDSFAHKPSPELKFAEKLTTDLVESTDLVASTPHRLLSFFEANFLPDSIYVWLFTGLVIGTGIINLMRVTASFLGLRGTTQKIAEADKGSSTALQLEIFSTISLGNPIPTQKPSPWAFMTAWAEAIFKFLFSFALWYWVLWSIASATLGIGVTVVPFGIAVAIAVPLVLTLIQVFGDQTFQYLFNKEAKTSLSAAGKIKLQSLEKLHLLDEELGSKDTQSLSTHLSFIDTQLELAEQSSRHDKLIEEPSQFTKRSRLALSTLIGFGTGFIMMTLVFFAMSSFLGTGLAGVLIPVVASALAGIIYAIKAYRHSVETSSAHERAFRKLDEEYKTSNLADKLNRFYRLVLDKRQQAAAKGIKMLKAAADNPEFITHGKTEPKTSAQRAWTKFKKIIHRFVIFIGGTESGSLLFRVIFGLVGGLATLGLASNPLSIVTIGIIMSIVALGWGITKLAHFYSEKAVAKEKLFLEQSDLYIRALSREYSYLDTELSKIPSSPSSRREAEIESDDDAEVTHLLVKEHSAVAIAIDDPVPVEFQTLADAVGGRRLSPAGGSPAPQNSAKREDEDEGEGGDKPHPAKH